MNNKVLTIVLIVLLVFFGANKLYKGKKTASFDKTFSSLDIEKVDKIRVSSNKDIPDYELLKKEGKWVGYEKNREYRLNEDRINSFLTAISDIQIQRLAAKSKDKWDQYEVGEDSGRRIEVFSNDKSVLDFIVGRFSFDQQSRTATSYLRKMENEEVYAMDGFASMTLNQDFNGLRYNKIIDIENRKIDKVTMEGSGQSFTIQNKDSGWYDFMGNALDSVKVTSYIKGVEGLTSAEFADDSGNQDIATIIFGMQNGETESLSISRDSLEFIIETKDNTYFKSDSSGIFKKLVLDFMDLVK